MKPLPLRATLTLIYAVVLALVLTAEGWADHAALKRQLDSSVTADLDDKARALHGYLRFNGGDVSLAYDQNDADEAAFIADATRYFQVYDAGSTRLLEQSPGLEALGLKYTSKEVSEIQSAPGMRDVQTDRGRLRLTSTVIATPEGGVYLVQVGALLDRLDASLEEFDRVLVIRTAIGMVIAVLVGLAFSGWALAPLKRLATHARAIDISNLQARLPVRGAGDELDDVVIAFNQSLSRLERSVNEMRQFSTALAHELRTPLAILRGEAEVALAAPHSAEAAKDQLASQIDEYDRLTRLINRILTLARAEAGELTIALAPLELSSLVTDVKEQVEALAEAKQITLHERTELVTIHGDRGWLERLLLILLDNAIKFTPAGGRIDVAVRRLDDQCVLTVADTGRGINAADQPHVFEPFYRGDETSDGAGIGLALAKWIATAHHGSIGVTSSAGAGTTFTLIIPAVDDIKKN